MTLSKDVFLKGENVYLRALAESDIEGNYRLWLNDAEITEYNSHGRFPMTPERLLEYVKTTTTSNNILALAVIDNNSNKHIGNISLQAINWIDRNAEISTGLINNMDLVMWRRARTQAPGNCSAFEDTVRIK